MRWLRANLTWLLAGLAVALMIGGLIFAWWRVGFRLDKMSSLGDALAPLVGILSLAAVVAALYSVHLQGAALVSQESAMAEQLRLQQEALTKQDHEIKHQQGAVTEQLTLQRAALAKQDEEIKQQQAALHTELAYRRRADLRNAYVPLLAATERYVDQVKKYEQWLRALPFADKSQRYGQEAPADSAYMEVQRTCVDARLIDVDPARESLRRFATLEISLRSPIDSKPFNELWCDVLSYEQLVRIDHLFNLQRSLEQELGLPARAESDTPRPVTAEILVGAKAKADRARDQIAKSYVTPT